MRRIAPTVALTLAACLAVAGCGTDDGPARPEGPGASLEERLGGLAGVADVSVSQGEVEQDGPEATSIVVTVEDDPSVDEVAAVLTELTDPGVDGNVRTMTHLGVATGYGGGVLARDVAVRDVTDPADVEEAAELFVAGLALVEDLGGDAGADVDYDSELTADGSGAVVGVGPASDSPADVDAAVDAVAADPVLSEAGALVVGQDLP